MDVVRLLLLAGLGYVFIISSLINSESRTCAVRYNIVDVMDHRPIDRAVDRGYNLNYDTTKAERLLGLKYRSMEETLSDIVEDVKGSGWDVAGGSG
jgi:hypothetical protein